MSRKDEELERRIEALEKKLEAMSSGVSEIGTAVNQNTEAFADAFENVDARLAVMTRIFNDFLASPSSPILPAGTEVKSVLLPNGRRLVDFTAYLEEYQAMLGFSGFVANLKNLSPPPPPETPIEDAPETSMVFGGPGAQP